MANRLIFVFFFLSSSACSSRSQVPEDGAVAAGDYGDAPEGRPTEYRGKETTGAFPTRSENAGRTLSVDRAWLGSPGSVEKGAVDTQDPDGRPNVEYDADDGLEEMFVSLETGEATAELALDVGIADAPSKYWLNVLVDLNQDGKWGGVAKGGEPEWAIQNFEVELEGKKKGRVELPSFAFKNGPDVPGRVWMRVALTNELVPKEWDGSGQFAAGEIEDYLVELPELPLVDVDCKNQDHDEGNWTFDGERTTLVECRVESLNDEAKSGLEFVMKRGKGGVTHSGLCMGTAIDGDSTEKEVHGGPLSLAGGSLDVKCLFVKEWGLPSDWTLEVPSGRRRSKVTARSVEVGVTGANRGSFRIEKGSCSSRCSSSSQCFGDRICTNDCCVPPWADECETLGTEDCGRCCAISAGARAADCVRQACVK